MAPDLDPAGRAEILDLSDGGFLEGSAIRRMLVVPGFLTPDEAQTLVDLSHDADSVSESVESSYVGGMGEKLDGDEQGTFRSSRTTFLHDHLERDHPVVAKVLARIHATANIPFSNGESLQLTEYNTAKADRYIPHMDSGIGMARTATALMYLKTLRPGDGGGTVFLDTRLSERGAASMEEARKRALQLAREPSDAEFLASRGPFPPPAEPRPNASASEPEELAELHAACGGDTLDAWAAAPDRPPSGCAPGSRLLVRPVTGMAVFWFNHDHQGRLDGSTWHAACELEPKEPGSSKPRQPKLIAQRWMTWHAQNQPTPQGIRPIFPENELLRVLDTCLTPDGLRAAGMEVPRVPRHQLVEMGWMLPSNFTSAMRAQAAG